MGQTNTFNIPYPELSDNVNVQQDIKTIAVATDVVLTDFQVEINTFEDTVNDSIDDITTDVNTAINETIPDLIDNLGLENLLGNGLTWGQIKGN